MKSDMKMHINHLTPDLADTRSKISMIHSIRSKILAIALVAVFNIVLAERADEIGLLAQEFNIMVTRLNKAEEINLRYQNHLQDLVNERTHKLIQTQEAAMISMTH